MKSLCNDYSITIAGMILILSLFIPKEGATADTKPVPIISFNNDILVIDAKNRPLSEILVGLSQECRIAVKGLDNKLNTKVTLQYSGVSIEDAIKSLLRNIGESNYALEYSNRTIVKVSVMKSIAGSSPGQSPTSTAEATAAPVVNYENRAVRVSEIIPGSQAEALSIRPDDLIIEYDGVRIDNSQQLINEVKAKTETDQVEIVVVRDDIPMKIYLKGGLIGVKINTVSMPPDKMNSYYNQ